MLWLWCQKLLPSSNRPLVINTTAAVYPRTIVKLNNLLDVVIDTAFIKQPIPQQGCRHHPVQIDECLLEKRKVPLLICNIIEHNHYHASFIYVKILFQYNVGRLVPQRWVLGILVTCYNPPRLIAHYVEDRTAATLLPIINHYVTPGSLVWTDCFRSYASLRRQYDHQTVNHSYNFVDPVTGKL